MLNRSGLGAANLLQRAGRRLGFLTVRELLFHLPRRYDDLREMKQLGELVWVEEGTVVSARVHVADVRVEPSFRRRIQRTIAVLEDSTGTIDATWFGRRFIERRLFPGAEIIVSGKLKRFGRKLTIDNPDFQPVGRDDELLHVGRIVPVYRLTAGLTAARLRIAMREALDRAGERLRGVPARPDPRRRGAGRHRRRARGGALPGVVRGSRRGPPAPRLRRAAGAPARDGRPAPAARPRRGRGDRGSTTPANATLRASVDRRRSGRKLGDDVDLTPDQDAAIDAIRSDLARPTPMLRLLQGDVGSGKTAVAAWALGAAALDGRQGALLAPTDLLARQHHATLASLLEDAGHRRSSC